MPKRQKLTVEAVVTDRAGRVLLVRTGSRQKWELPGGKVKRRESVVDAVIRETLEETGIAVTVDRLVGIFFIKAERTHDFVFTAKMKSAGAKPKASPPEISDAAFFSRAKLPKPMAKFTVDRIRGARRAKAPLMPVELKSGQWIG